MPMALRLKVYTVKKVRPTGQRLTAWLKPEQAHEDDFSFYSNQDKRLLACKLI
jgi:hypothetical protein